MGEFQESALALCESGSLLIRYYSISAEPFRPTLSITPLYTADNLARIIHTFIACEYLLKVNGKTFHFSGNEVFKGKTNLFHLPVYILEFHPVAGLEGISGHCSTAVI